MTVSQTGSLPSNNHSSETKPGHELSADGELVGRDPRKMTPADLIALRHVAMSPLKALRLRCIDCCGGSASEVRMCVAVDCPAWPYRMATNPWRSKRELSEKQLAALASAREKSRLLSGANENLETEGTSTPEKMTS